MLTRRSREARRRAVFALHDGVRRRRIDPVTVYRRLLHDHRFDGKLRGTLKETPGALWRSAAGRHAAAVRRAFAAPPADVGGLDEWQLLTLESDLCGWFAARQLEARPLIETGVLYGLDVERAFERNYPCFCALWWAAETARQLAAIPAREGVAQALGLVEHGEPYPVESFQALHEDAERAAFEHDNMRAGCNSARAMARPISFD